MFYFGKNNYWILIFKKREKGSLFPVPHFVLSACFCELEATQKVDVCGSDYFNRFIYISILFLQKCFPLWVGSIGTGDVLETTGPEHVVYEGKGGMLSSLQCDLGWLWIFLLECEQSSCWKVSRNSLEFQWKDLRLMVRSYEEVYFCLS